MVVHLPPLPPQGCTNISGRPARLWPLCNELGGEESLDHTRKSCMTKARRALIVLGTSVAGLWQRMRLPVILWPSYRKSWPEWNGTNVTRVSETLVVTNLDYGQDAKFIHN